MEADEFENFSYVLAWKYFISKAEGYLEQCQINYKMFRNLFNGEPKLFYTIMDKIHEHFYENNYSEKKLKRLINQVLPLKDEELWQDHLTDDVEDIFTLQLLL